MESKTLKKQFCVINTGGNIFLRYDPHVIYDKIGMFPLTSV